MFESLSPADDALLDELKRTWKAEIGNAIAPLQRKVDGLAMRSSRPPGALELAIPDVETAGMRFVKSEAYGAWIPKNPGGLPSGANLKVTVGALDTKATMLTSGTLPAPTRLPGVAAYPVPPAGFVDALAWRPVTSNTVQYLRQTSLPSPGAKTQVAEGDVKAEQTIAVALETEPILTLACWTTASTQILLDLDAMQTFLDLSLLTAVRQEIDRQALVGVGPPNELKGILSIATPYNITLTKTGDSFIDVVSHAITQLASVGIAADVLVASPADAEALRLVKTTYGEYVFGDPSAMSAAPALWGVKIIVDAHLPAGKFLIGQSSAAGILDRMEAQVAISFEHSDYFTRNLCAIRAEARVGLAVFVPGAWCTGNFSGAVAAAESSPHASAPPSHPKK